MGDRVNVTLSVGGTKIGAGAVNSAGEIVVKVEEVPAHDESSSLFDGMVDQIAKVIDKVGAQNVIGIGVSFPECVYPPARVVADPENLPPVKDSIQQQIEDMVSSKLGLSLAVEVLHDAAAAVLGEVSPGGTLPHCKNVVFVVWGTGIASGVISDGSLYWRDPVVDRMIGEVGRLLVRNAEGVYEHRLISEWGRLVRPETSVDNRICGPSLTRRFRRRMKEDPRGESLLRSAGKVVDRLELVDINRLARDGNDFAIELIEEASREMGEALVPFIHYWREVRGMDFANNIIIGSGVTKLGEGVEKEGKAALITVIRDEISKGLAKLGTSDYDTSNVIISKIGYEREFLAFMAREGI